MAKSDVTVVGGGHNGLVAACYLAKAGVDVLVLEQSDKPGGGARTEERIPGYRFDTHSVAHNIINMTEIPQELDLEGAGLEYIEMDPFSVALHADGRRVRFYRSVEKTVASIAESSREEAEAYQNFMDIALPLVRLILPGIQGNSGLKSYPKRIPDFARLLKHGPSTLVRDLLSPYDSLLKRYLYSDLTRGPVSAFAAHASVGPQVPNGALFAFWQGAYHLFGQWHARGGAEALTWALLRRLESFGGKVRCNAKVIRIDARGGKIKAVELEGGERIETGAVISAIHPKTTLLDLLDPPLSGKASTEIGTVRTSNAVQALIHIGVDRLPPYPNVKHEDYNGLQSYVDTMEEMRQGFIQAEAGYLPDPLPLYSFTTSALDDSLAPAGHHTIYLACPSSPAIIKGGWDAHREEFIEKALQVVEGRAPGFRDSIKGIRAYTPDEMESDLCWPLGHPMYLDLSLDQLGIFRPTRRLSSHRTPVEGLYISGAGTNPAGGIAGTPGKMAANVLLKDRQKNLRK